MINKLGTQNFKNYFKPPMKLLTNVDNYSGVSIKKYLLEIIEQEKLDVPFDDIDIHYLYVDEGWKYEHLIINYGLEDRHIVIITNFKEIIGYHLLNLRRTE